MKLHPPFMISARLLPALKIGDATLSLVKVEPSGDRQRATFALDIPGQEEYLDAMMQSGVGGFRARVGIFETFLSFLLSCAESLRYGERRGKMAAEANADPDSNASLFPLRIAQWAADNHSNLEDAWWNIKWEGDLDSSPNESLIED